MTASCEERHTYLIYQQSPEKIGFSSNKTQFPPEIDNMKSKDRIIHSQEDVLKRAMVLAEELEGESERAAAIVGAAWVEDSLGGALASFLIPHAEAWKSLFSGSGPLATFSTKIDLACLVGMISEAIRSDLHSIRQVRNEFAHQIAHRVQHTRLGFATQHLRDRCLSLRCVKHEELTDARTAFTRACVTLSSDFEVLAMLGEQVRHGGQVVAASENMHGATIMQGN